MADEPTDEATDQPTGEAEGGEGTAVAVLDEPEPPAPIETVPVDDGRAEERKTRLWLPLLIPIGAILVVAFVTFNISRVFLASSESSTTPAVLIASGITLSILIGASLIAAFPEIRTSSLVIGLCGVMVVVMLAGSLVLGASEPHEEGGGGYQEPTGEAINTLEVDALPTLRLGSGGQPTSEFTAPGGVNAIKYVDKGGTHTLVFEQAFPGFELQVPTGVSELKADLKPDTTYVIYCTIPGHRAAGMEADIKVGAAGGAPEPGTENPTETTVPANGQTPAPDPSSDTDPAEQSSTGGS